MQEIDKLHKIPDNYSHKYIASFEAFLRLIQTTKLDRYFNTHWQSIKYTCQPCYVNYNFISHTETSTEDSAYILDKIFEDQLVMENINGPYQKSIYKVKPIFDKLDFKLVQDVYEIYKDDFLMFGYSLEDDY